MASYWVDVPGYPVVYVSPTKQGIRLNQERYLLGSANQPKGHWPVPIHYITGKAERYAAAVFTYARA